MGGKNAAYLIAWFLLAPPIVWLFMQLNWGVNGIILALLISVSIGWIANWAVKRIKRIFPSWKTLAYWSFSGEIPSAEEQDQGEQGDSEEGNEFPSTHPLLPAPADEGEGLPSPVGRPAQARRHPSPYAVSLGSHTLDLDVIYSKTLLVTPPGGNITKHLVREVGRIEITTIIVDMRGQFDKIPDENPNGFFIGSPLSQLSPRQANKFLPTTPKNGEEVGKWLIHHGGQFVMRFHSYQSTLEATVTFLSLLRGVYQWEKNHAAQGMTPTPCLVLLNDAHLFLPYQRQYSIAHGDPDLVDSLEKHLKLFMSKTELGLYFYLLSHKPTRMKPDALEQDLWFIQQGQVEELRYLSEYTGLPLGNFFQVAPHQAMVMDIAAKNSFILTLPEQDEDIINVPLLPPAIGAAGMAVTDSLTVETAAATPQAYQGEAPPPIPLYAERDAPRPTLSPVAIDAPSFTDAELAWACFLYSKGRTKPSTVQSPPREFRGIAQGLGLPVHMENMMNRNKAVRLIGYVQGLPAEKRRGYTAKAERCAAPLETPQRLGGALKPGPDPPIWQLPPSTVLDPRQRQAQLPTEQITAIQAALLRTLSEQHVEADVLLDDLRIGPRVLQFGIRPKRYAEMVNDRKGGRVAKVDHVGDVIYSRTSVNDILRLEPDFEVALNALGFFGDGGARIRMIKAVPGTGCVGLEAPNPVPASVTFREVLESPEFQEASAPLSIPMGKDLFGNCIVRSLQKEPHRITAGSTGAGKSVAINVDLCSLLFRHTPDEVRVILIDPKKVELSGYAGIPHLLAPIATTVEEAWPILNQLVLEMERRYYILAAVGARDLEKYHQKRKERPELENLPYLVALIDEVGELMMQMRTKSERSALEALLVRLLQLGRAAGIHVQLSTQRPSVDVLTGLIKANAPARVAFRTSSLVDSRTILDTEGAEKLLGRGDGLYQSPEDMCVRFQHAMVEDREIERIVAHWHNEKKRVDVAGSSQYAQYQLPAWTGEKGASPGGEPDEQRQEEQLYAQVVEALQEIGREGTGVFSVDKLRHGRLVLGLPGMKHEQAAAIRDALLRDGHIGEYSNQKKGYPILKKGETKPIEA